MAIVLFGDAPIHTNAIAHDIIPFFLIVFPIDVLLFGLETGISVLVSTHISHSENIGTDTPNWY